MVGHSEEMLCAIKRVGVETQTLSPDPDFRLEQRGSVELGSQPLMSMKHAELARLEHRVIVSSSATEGR